MPAELKLPCLCLVADCSVADPGDLPARVAAAVDGGVNLVQLRAKEMPGGYLLSLTQELQHVIADRAVLLVNERVDVAAIAGADGVQLGEQALPASPVRRLLPAGSLVGRSVHSVEGATQAVDDGADFLVVGTMFATSSHPGEEPAGPALLRQVEERCALPLIGIGGITPGNLGEVVEAGASGVAVIRSILAANDPREASLEMLSALEMAWQRHGRVLDNGARLKAGRSS